LGISCHGSRRGYRKNVEIESTLEEAAEKSSDSQQEGRGIAKQKIHIPFRPTKGKKKPRGTEFIGNSALTGKGGDERKWIN